MIPRLKRDDDAAPVVRSTDLVDGWLKVFLALLKLPGEQAAGIREELEGHLRERVRDLMVSGAAEGEATRQAISELGEAADVAARYRALRTEPRRRLIMHATLFTAAGAALALSIAAFRGGQPPQPDAKAEAAKTAAMQQFTEALLTTPDGTQRQPLELSLLLNRAMATTSELPTEVKSSVLSRLLAARQGVQAKAEPAAYVPQPLPPELAGLKADWSLKDSTVSDAFEFLGKAASLPVNVRWNLLTPATGLEPSKPTITMHAKQAGVEAFLRALNETVGAHGGATVDLRVIDGVLEVAPREYFDRRERELVSYDLSGVIAARTATYNEPREKVVPEVRDAIIQFVSPEDWKDNGGDLGEMTVVGDRLFINAPARFHPQIRWILEQLPSGKGHSDAGPRDGAQNPDTRSYALKHTVAADVLDVLRGMESIKSIDFNRCAADARTNSIIAGATPAQHEWLKIAIDSLDRPADHVPVQRGDASKEHAAGVIPAAQPENRGVVYLTGEISRPGTYSMSEDGITVRRLLAAAGGLPVDARVVIVSDTRDGKSVVLHQFDADELRQPEGPDPALKKGQMVCVR